MVYDLHIPKYAVSVDLIFFLMISAKMMTSSNNRLGENISNVIRLPQVKFEDLTLNSVEAIWISHLFKAPK